MSLLFKPSNLGIGASKSDPEILVLGDGPGRSRSKAWPVAATLSGPVVCLEELLESEFNATQLREFTRMHAIPIKGMLKSALIEQLVTWLNARASSLSENPDSLLNGLSAELADFMRRLFTAWDVALPFPRSLIRELLRSNDERHITETLENLRKHALVFPSLSGANLILRDAHYHTLPLGDFAQMVPVLHWNLPGGRKNIKIPTHKPLLECVENVLNALFATGTEVQLRLRPHARAAEASWLKTWDHLAEEAERVFQSRPGWLPDPRTGIEVILRSVLTKSGSSALESQTGLTHAQIQWIFSLLCTLQLIEYPAGSSDKPTRIGVLGESYESWIANPPETQLRALWTAWLNSAFDAYEVQQASTTHKFSVRRAVGARDLTPETLAAEWCALRRFVTRGLRGLDTETWVSWDALRYEMFSLRSGCAHTRDSTDAWWFSPHGSAAARLAENKLADWLRCTGRIIESMLLGPLSWFGAVECRASGDGDVAELRITAIGEWLLGHSTQPLPAAAQPAPRKEEPIRWINAQSWRVPPSPARVELIALSRKLGEPADTPFTYTLTMRSVEQALSSGITPDMCKATFEKFEAPLPAKAQALIAKLSRNFGRLRLYEGLTIIEFSDDLALRELMANTLLAQYIICQLSPRAVVVRDEAMDTYMQQLIAKGHTPRVIALGGPHD